MRTRLKTLALAGCAVAAAMALALAGCGGGGSAGGSNGSGAGSTTTGESYRVVSVDEHNGDSSLTRGGGEVIVLYDGLNLQSGDDVVTGSGADATLAVDSDKYLYAEENTHFWLEAAGQEGSSLTSIHLEEGGVLFRLDTKLNAAECFQVSTPNATMSVRGTCVVVRIIDAMHSQISILDGKVECTVSNPVTGETKSIMIKAGQKATVVSSQSNNSGERNQLSVKNLQEEEVAGFVAVELQSGEFLLSNSGSPTSPISLGDFKPATQKKILEFSIASGKTMSFDNKQVTPEQAQEVLSNAEEEGTTITEAVNKLSDTTAAAEGQDNPKAADPAGGATEPEQPAHVHSYTSKILVKATCTKKGKVEYRCACGESYTETIPMKEHNYVEVPGKDATCTETGLTVGMSCSVCSNVKLEQYEIPALGHDIVEDPEVPATCTEPGKAAVQHCSRCDYTAGGEELPATGHSYSYVGGSSASCTAGGYSTYRCNNCGNTYSESSDALGHDMVLIEGKDPTCTQSGDRYYECSRCDATKTETVDALGHSVGENGICVVCKEKVSECDHKWEVINEAKAATCLVPGTTESRRCTLCGQQEGGQEIAALGHDRYEEKREISSCTSPVIVFYRCTRCDDYSSKELDAPGHEWAPVTLGDGITVQQCTRCYQYYENTECAHAETTTATIDATCTEFGSYFVICADCNAVLNETYLPLADHKYDENGFCIYCKKSSGELATNGSAAGGITIEGNNQTTDIKTNEDGELVIEQEADSGDTA